MSVKFSSPDDYNQTRLLRLNKGQLWDLLDENEIIPPFETYEEINKRGIVDYFMEQVRVGDFDDVLIGGNIINISGKKRKRNNDDQNEFEGQRKRRKTGGEEDEDNEEEEEETEQDEEEEEEETEQDEEDIDGEEDEDIDDDEEDSDSDRRSQISDRRRRGTNRRRRRRSDNSGTIVRRLDDHVEEEVLVLEDEEEDNDDDVTLNDEVEDEDDEEERRPTQRRGKRSKLDKLINDGKQDDIYSCINEMIDKGSFKWKYLYNKLKTKHKCTWFSSELDKQGNPKGVRQLKTLVKAIREKFTEMRREDAFEYLGVEDFDQDTYELPPGVDREGLTDDDWEHYEGRHSSDMDVMRSRIRKLQTDLLTIKAWDAGLDSRRRTTDDLERDMRAQSESRAEINRKRRERDSNLLREERAAKTNLVDYLRDDLDHGKQHYKLERRKVRIKLKEMNLKEMGKLIDMHKDPDIKVRISDWKTFLGNFGMDLDDMGMEEVDD